jgi:Zn-dependent protease
VTQQHLIFYGCLVVAVILHEISHGVVAYAYGDDTAKRAGRLTLNPIPHIDPLGSIILPAMAVLANLPVLGWAKPVPVNPARLRNPRKQMLIVGLAGPLTNFALMVAAAVPAKIILAGASPDFCPSRSLTFIDPHRSLTGDILASFAVVNLLLGLFNLLPIPPLDGSSLIERVLPSRYLPTWWKFRPYGFLVLFVGLFYFNFFGRILSPFLNDLCRYLVR